MKTNQRRSYPYYPFLFATFPIFALMASNRYETRFIAIFRPLAIALLFCGLLYGLAFLIFRKNRGKAALVAGLSTLMFFTYGHVYNLVNQVDFLKSWLGHHWFLMAVFIVVWIIVFILACRHTIKPDFTKVLNLFGIILVALPLGQSGWFYLDEAITHYRLKNKTSLTQIKETGLNYQPDVYYIILDMFARPDVLQNEYHIDLSEFLKQMENMGFYYARESRSNYGETFNSISTALNLEMIEEFVRKNGVEPDSVQNRDLLIHNEVRSILESINYETVAFTTGYRWSEWSDADIYYQYQPVSPFGPPTSFETLLYKQSIFYPFRGYIQMVLPKRAETREFVFIGKEQQLHIEMEKNILEMLPKVALNPQPTFTFAHILIPHPPYVFAADGGLLDDPGFTAGYLAGPINDAYALEGYTNQVLFISQQITEISQTILTESENPPIIINQGDHGWKASDRDKILNLYYFPTADYSALYPSITPVNSFRVVLTQFFGLDLPLLPDQVHPWGGPNSLGLPSEID